MGALPWVIPLTRDMATLRAIYDRLDGVFLPGGVDMDPRRTGERSSVCGATDPDRDRVEIALRAVGDGGSEAAARRVSRRAGAQRRGRRHAVSGLQHWTPDPIKHDYWPSEGHHRDDLVHEIRVERGTQLASIMGAGEST